ncbi:MAG: FAD-dependent 5-carboxymethylaminomethyl-2-thiouridine(34) oxidoreductase MnmC [Gallionellaceae bacterium]
MRSAIVIGGGVAGCAAAYALAQRGFAVTLLERSPRLANGASGNRIGILHARFSAGDIPLHQFVRAAYEHALSLLDKVLPVDGVSRAQCGLLQLACNAVEQKRIARLAERAWPEEFMRFVDAKQASQLAGVEMTFGGLWFPRGGWLVPGKYCETLTSHTNITQGLDHQVNALERSARGWQVSGVSPQNKHWQMEAETVVVCSAYEAKQFAQFADFSLMAVRGQITELPENAESQALKAVVCGNGYCTPANKGVHVIGATHAFEDETTELRVAEQEENLANLVGYAPALRQAWSELSLQRLNGRAAVRCSAPGSMPLVGEVQPGLYCSLAHGTRGLLTAGLSGELVAAQICGETSPVPEVTLSELDPLPRIRKKG